MSIINQKEVDSWLFEHIAVHGHRCDGIKGVRARENSEPALMNVKFIDRVTNEEIEVLYD